jgi:predicted Zn-dependent peptidase
MEYKLSKLSNGLRVVTVALPNLESVTVTIWVGVGSRAEGDKIAGISHFLEHMVFKGSKKRPNAKAIAEAVDAIGGEFNAATGKEWTNFYIKARSANLDLAFDVLSDMVLNPLLKEEEIEREKGVIVEEMAMYEDTPIMKVGDVFEQLIFSKDTLGRDIIGTERSVRGLKKQDFIGYREQHYYTDNIVVSVAGGIEDKDVLVLAQKYFGSLPRAGIQEERSYNFVSVQKSPQVLLKTKKNEQAHLILGFLAGKRGSKDRFTEIVLSAILGRGMSSRLFTEVRERRGLAYSVRTSIDNFYDTGEFATYAGVDVSKAKEAIKVMLEEHYKLASEKKGISPEELKKAKEYIKGHLALSLEDTKEINNLFGESELMLGKIETPEVIFEGIDKVGREDVVSLAKRLFVPERLNLAIIGPFKDRSQFEKIIG